MAASDNGPVSASSATSAGPSAARDKAPPGKVKVTKTAQAADDTIDLTTEGSGEKKEREGGRSLFLKVAGNTWVRNTSFKDLLTITTTKENASSGTTTLTLGFRDGRELSAAVEDSEVTKTTKRMKEYARPNPAEITEQKGRSTFLKIHGETYLHFSLLKDVVSIASDEKSDGNYSLQINFEDGRSVVTEIEKEEIQRVVKRVKDFTKRMTKLEASGVTDGETDAETDAPVAKATASGKKKKAVKSTEDSVTAATSST